MIAGLYIYSERRLAGFGRCRWLLFFVSPPLYWGKVWKRAEVDHHRIRRLLQGSYPMTTTTTPLISSININCKYFVSIKFVSSYIYPSSIICKQSLFGSGSFFCFEVFKGYPSTSTVLFKQITNH